jgi:UDP-GlcNAc:undecaprenyl-phosphate/decaprenyl-phosphate GlcNAc-1-phosphate transferase
MGKNRREFMCMAGLIHNNMFYFLLLLFFISFLLSLVFVPIFIKISKQKKLFDVPEGDALKIHKIPISYLGGLAMFLSVVVGLVLIVFFYKIFYLQIIGIISGSLIIFLLGFWDDLKWKHISKIQPRKKFLFLIILSLLASIFLVMGGVKIGFFSNIYLAIFLTAGYVFIFINAVNYQDGMDGLAGGLLAISLIGFIILSIVFGNSFSLFFSLCALGAVLGFLVFNFPPAKIFMGDSGAYFLGFVLVIMVSFYSKHYNVLCLIGPVFIVGIPIFDGVFTNIRRIFSKKSIFLGDRSHFYDGLLGKGFSTKKTLFTSYLIQFLFMVIGVAITATA